MEEKKLSIAARRKLARAAKRTAKKRLLKKKLLAKRMKTPAKLQASAQKAAKNALVKKITGGKSYSDLSITQKQTIDNKLKPAIIAKVARKMLPKIKAKEKERLKRVRGGGNEKIDEDVDPITIASVVAATVGTISASVLVAKKLHTKFTNRDTEFDVEKTYQLIKRKYPGIMKMIHDEKFGKGRLQAMVRNIEKEIPGLKKKKFLNNIVSVIDQLIRYDRWYKSGTAASLAPLDKDRFNESKHGVYTLKVNGSQPEVSAHYVGGKLKPFVFKTREEAKKHCKKVGGKPFESSETGKFYVEFTKIDGPINEKSVSKSQQRLFGMVHAYNKGELKKSDVDDGLYSKIKKIANGMTKKDTKKMAKTDHDDLPEKVPTNESKENQENLKDLKAILDVAKMLSDKSPYFKGRGSKKEYIKMLVHKIQKLSESKKQKLLTKMDAYKKVRKPTMPKSIPMKNKKAYDRKDFKRGKYD